MILTLEVKSVDELRLKVKELAELFGVSGTTELHVTLPETKAVAEDEIVQDGETYDEEPETEAPKRTRGRPKKAEKTSKKVEETEDEIAEEAAPATKEMAVAALQKVNAKFGLPKAREVLSRFKCNRISELKEADFGGFVSVCEQVLA